MILKVTPDEVRTKAQQIRSERQAMESLMQQMQNEVNKLPSEFWRSRSGTDFGERYQSVQRNCQGALDTLMQHISNLETAAAKYDEIESSQTQRVSQLNTTNIF